MKIILSPAKRMNTSQIWNAPFHSEHSFAGYAAQINQTLRALDSEELSVLMKISPAIAALNHQRIRSWNPEISIENGGKPAVFLFDGGAYKYLRASEFSEKDFTYAQENLKILSGLYGILRPLDLILPYRLEMGTNLRVTESKNLYAFWKNVLTEHLKGTLSPEEPLLNLASVAYSDAVNFEAIPHQVITPVFKNKDREKLRVVGFWSKEARGDMAREVIAHRIDRIEDLKRLKPRGFKYSEEMSNGNAWVFIK